MENKKGLNVEIQYQTGNWYTLFWTFRGTRRVAVVTYEGRRITNIKSLTREDYDRHPYSEDCPDLQISPEEEDRIRSVVLTDIEKHTRKVEQKGVYFTEPSAEPHWYKEAEQLVWDRAPCRCGQTNANCICQ